MDFIKVKKQYYCGIDLHADVMYACVMTKSGKVVFHHEMPTDISRLLMHLKPYLSSIAICAESTFNWYWLSDACTNHKIPFFLGHALYMKLIHGGKAKNDRIDAKVMAELLRTGFFPPAYPYPETMRATRDLLRRRNYFVQQHAELLRHMKTLLYQHGYMNLPSFNHTNAADLRKTCSAYKLSKDAEYSLLSNIDAIEHLDAITSNLEQRILKTARNHDNHSLTLLRSLQGCGPIISLTILYEMHTIKRFKNAKCFSSYARVVKVERSSHGKRMASANNKIGNPNLHWAFGQLAISAQRFYKEIKDYTDKLIKKFGVSKAYTLLSHKFAVTVYYMLKNNTTFDVKKFVGA